MNPTSEPGWEPGWEAAGWESTWASDPCSEVLRRVSFFVDNELSRADREAIHEHLARCGPCLHEVDVERVVKALISRACCEQAPTELRHRVMFSIRQVQMEFGFGGTTNPPAWPGTPPGD